MAIPSHVRHDLMNLPALPIPTPEHRPNEMSQQSALTVPNTASIDFELFETMLVLSDRRRRVRRLQDHLDRMEASSRELSFRFDRSRAEALIRTDLPHMKAVLPCGGAGWRLRLSLQRDGQLSMRLAVIDRPPLQDGRIPIGIAAETWEPGPLSAHKTSLRSRHDAEMAAAKARGLFDLVCHREDERIFDGARSTVFVRLGRQWLTPRLEDGALAGTCRAQALAEGLWSTPVTEAALSLTDLMRADEIAVGNALLGARRARLIASEHP